MAKGEAKAEEGEESADQAAKDALQEVVDLEKVSAKTRQMLCGGDKQYQQKLQEARDNHKAARLKADMGLPMLDRIKMQGNKLAGAAKAVKRLEAAEQEARAEVVAATDKRLKVTKELVQARDKLKHEEGVYAALQHSEEPTQVLVEAVQGLKRALEAQAGRGTTSPEVQQMEKQLHGIAELMAKRAAEQAAMDKAKEEQSEVSVDEPMPEVGAGAEGAQPQLPTASPESPPGPPLPPVDPQQAVEAGDALERMLQTVGTYAELMDAVGQARDAEKEDTFQAELRRRLLGGLEEQG